MSLLPRVGEKPDFVSFPAGRQDGLVIPFTVEAGNLSTGSGLAGRIYLVVELSTSAADASGALRGATA
jgi:hypothetical protein